MSMKDFKDFVELEEGLKPEHKMRPGWMIKADPVLKAKIAANKAKQKEIKSLMGQKLKEDVLEENMHDEAEKHKDKASKALETSDMMAHHHHMADYHDALSQWHDSKGRSGAAQTHAEKSEQHADKYTALARKAKGVKEEVNLQEDDSHSVHINGRHWKTFDTKSHAENVAKKIKGATVHKYDAERLQQNYAAKLSARNAARGKHYDESVEQIDELSKETLKSYVDKVTTTEPRGKTPTGVLKSIKAIGGVTKAIRKQYSSK